MPNDPPDKSPQQEEIDRLKQDYGMGPPASPPGKLVTSGLEFGGVVIVCILLGLWLDSVFATKPWILLGLMVLGMVGGLIRLIRRAMRDAS